MINDCLISTLRLGQKGKGSLTVLTVATIFIDAILYQNDIICTPWKVLRAQFDSHGVEKLGAQIGSCGKSTGWNITGGTKGNIHSHCYVSLWQSKQTIMMKYQKVCVLLPSFIVLAKLLDLHYLIRKQTGSDQVPENNFPRSSFWLHVARISIGSVLTCQAVQSKWEGQDGRKIPLIIEKKQKKQNIQTPPKKQPSSWRLNASLLKSSWNDLKPCQGQNKAAQQT